MVGRGDVAQGWSSVVFQSSHRLPWRIAGLLGRGRIKGSVFNIAIVVALRLMYMTNEDKVWCTGHEYMVKVMRILA